MIIIYDEGKYMKRIFLLACLTLILCTGCIRVVEIPYSEVTAEDTVFADKFYFSQFSEKEQLVYKEIYQGILNQQEEIYVHSEEPEIVNDLLKSVSYDFGEIFWIDGSATSTVYEAPIGGDRYTVIEPSYIYSLEERKQREAEIEAEIGQIISAIPAEYTEYEIIKHIYEYLVDNVTYVEDAPDNQNLYSALVRRETVCAGYAKANQYLLNKMGIPCIYVMGTTTQEGKSESHAWNIVRCNEEYYHVDITWADSIELDEPSEVQMEPLYDYLCCSDAQLAATHIPDANYAYPDCVSEDLNYYRLHQMFYETIDKKQLLNAMYKSIDAKEKSTVFKFSNTMLYEQGKELVLQDFINRAAQHLADRYHLKEVMYSYDTQTVLNKVIIYWYYE